MNNRFEIKDPHRTVQFVYKGLLYLESSSAVKHWPKVGSFTSRIIVSFKIHSAGVQSTHKKMMCHLSATGRSHCLIYIFYKIKKNMSL